MVAPVVGPTTIVTSDVRGGIYYAYDRRVRYKQKKPFTLNLPYIRQIGTITRAARNGGFGNIAWDADALPPGVLPSSTYIRLNNLSYDKLRSKLYATAGLGVDLVEFNQSVRMITSTASTLLNFVKKLKRGDFVGAAQALRMKYLPRGVSKAKSFGNNFLEYHFGWEPLVKNIFDAIDVMDDPKRWFTCQKAGAREPLIFNDFADLGSVTRESTGSGTVTVVQGARISGIKNIHTHTLEALGLINPASLVWEVVPFSFVVDWFVNVGDYLRSYTDFTGLNIDSTYCVAYYEFSVNCVFRRKSDRALGWTNSTTYRYTERTTSLTGTALSAKRLKPPSASRAATAISLLLQRLR